MVVSPYVEKAIRKMKISKMKVLIMPLALSKMFYLKKILNLAPYENIF